MPFTSVPFSTGTGFIFFLYTQESPRCRFWLIGQIKQTAEFETLCLESKGKKVFNVLCDMLVPREMFLESKDLDKMGFYYSFLLGTIQRKSKEVQNYNAKNSI